MHMKETCSRGGSSTCVHVGGLRGHKNSNRAVATTAGSLIRCDDVTYVREACTCFLFVYLDAHAGWTWFSVPCALLD